jgi:hypothetical protein
MTATAAVDLATQIAGTLANDPFSMTATALMGQLQGTPIVSTPVPEGTQEVLVPGTTLTRPQQPYKDERWYAMTAGLVVIVLVIAAGNLYNVIRFALRRGGRS